MTSGTVSLLFLLTSALYGTAFAQQQAQFNQVLNVNGDMALNSFTFPDGSKVETFSQTQRQLIVNQNTPAISASQVTGSTGQPFVALMQNSMTISTNGATDLVGGQIELAMNPQMLQAAGINPDNAFVGQLAPDRQSWMVIEPIKSVNITDNTVRMVKMNNIDGEYMALGRQTAVTSQALTSFGTGQQNAVTINGTGLQEAEFTDGFRMSVRATQPMTMTVDVNNGVDQGMLAAIQNAQTVNDYRYSVTTNLAGVQPNLNRMVTVVQLPINPQRMQSMMQAMGVPENGQVAVGVAQRSVLGNPGGATGQLSAPGAAPGGTRRSRVDFRRSIEDRQAAAPAAAAAQPAQPQAAQPQAAQPQAAQPQAAQPQAAAPPQGQQQPQAGTPTNGNNPVATQLLLAPTFTPIQAQAVLDPVNMRIAVPVSQVDGEYILLMQQAGTAPQPQGQAQGNGQQQPTGGAPEARPSGAANEPRPSGAAEPRPAGAAEPRPAGEAEPRPTGEPTARNGTEPARPERRADNSTAIITDGAPKGYVYMTMREVNKMVELDLWGRQPPVGKMMTDFIKANPDLARD